MAAQWPLSRTREYDVNGDPVIGAQAFFYNVSTSTPQTIYSDAALSQALDQPVETDGYGRWPAVYLNPDPGEYRQRVLDADDTVLFDDDGVSVPLSATYTPPDAGETSVELLARTGDVKARHGTGTHSGWVRAAGRTIGSALSGASERANADCQDLFLYLYDADATLSVSGGRGANAAADWAADKNIALPDYRSRALVGLADMGNTALTILSGNTVDGAETVSTLGATLGTGTHTLTTAQMPTHDHTFTGAAVPNHTHDVREKVATGFDGAFFPIWANGDSESVSNYTVTSQPAGGHTPSGTISSAGSGDAHPNAQPSALVTFYIKL